MCVCVNRIKPKFLRTTQRHHVIALMLIDISKQKVISPGRSILFKKFTCFDELVLPELEAFFLKRRMQNLMCPVSRCRSLFVNGLACLHPSTFRFVDLCSMALHVFNRQQLAPHAVVCCIEHTSGTLTLVLEEVWGDSCSRGADFACFFLAHFGGLGRK